MVSVWDFLDRARIREYPRSFFFTCSSVNELHVALVNGSECQREKWAYEHRMRNWGLGFSFELRCSSRPSES